ncbi:hypothetical protein B296_00028642 [Ensete ventricosum]|uniref:Uncharacterized protein n=1 Tax=Ensete ventricosum TaxID=4639 RepID=A0A426YY38_ENSVE|nr:hypothetical protein B296_00028642 [Ensete ventricosum]
MDARFDAFETHIDNKLQELLREFRRSQSKSPNKPQHNESFSLKRNRSKKYDQGQDTGYPRMEFPRWKDGDPIGWISRSEKFFSFSQDSGGINGGDSFHTTRR